MKCCVTDYYEIPENVKLPLAFSSEHVKSDFQVVSRAKEATDAENNLLSGILTRSGPVRLAGLERTETATDFFFLCLTVVKKKHIHWVKTQAASKTIFGVFLLSNSHFNQANSCCLP